MAEEPIPICSEYRLTGRFSSLRRCQRGEQTNPSGPLEVADREINRAETRYDEPASSPFDRGVERACTKVLRRRFVAELYVGHHTIHRELPHEEGSLFMLRLDIPAPRADLPGSP